MCKFCDALVAGKKIEWNTRSTYADENLEDVLNKMSRETEWDDYYSQDFSQFSLQAYDYHGDIIVSVEYREELSRNEDDEKVIISPFSEAIQFNFCPMCGEWISKGIRAFEDMERKIKIKEEE